MNLRLLHTGTGHTAALYTCCEGKNPLEILTAGGDGWVASWDLAKPKDGHLLAITKAQNISLVYYPHGNSLIIGNLDGTILWVDLQNPEQPYAIIGHKKGVFDLVLYRDNLYSCGGDGTLTQWDMGLKRPAISLQFTAAKLRKIAISSDGNQMAIGASDGCIYLLKMADLSLQRVIQAAHLPSVFCLKWSPDGRFLFSGGRDAQIRQWDAHNDFKLVQTIPAHLFTVNALCFSPDGQYLASASRDKTIKIWRFPEMQLIQVLDVVRSNGHLNSVNALHWTAEGLVSVSDDRTVKFWRTETVRDLPTPKIH